MFSNDGDGGDANYDALYGNAWLGIPRRPLQLRQLRDLSRALQAPLGLAPLFLGALPRRPRAALRNCSFRLSSKYEYDEYQ